MNSPPKKFIPRYAPDPGPNLRVWRRRNARRTRTVPLQPTTSIIHEATVLPGTRRNYHFADCFVSGILSGGTSVSQSSPCIFGTSSGASLRGIRCPESLNRPFLLRCYLSRGPTRASPRPPALRLEALGQDSPRQARCQSASPL